MITHFALKLDDLGRPAWIALMIVAFIVFWPLGLGVLAYLIWSGRMSCNGNHRGAWDRKMARFQEKMERWGGGTVRGYQPTGNRAFDKYRQETLRRLEEEANEFQGFLDRLRMARDKAEFDQFMNDRRNRPSGAGGSSGESPPA